MMTRGLLLVAAAVAGMMSGSSSVAGGWGAMMGSDLSWICNGTWQHMINADWQRAGGYMTGTG